MRNDLRVSVMKCHAHQCLMMFLNVFNTVYILTYNGLL